MQKKVAFHNLGCKVNAYETEAMQEMLKGAGYEIVPFEPGADIYIINTCTVTNIADRKSRQMLHRAKKMNPDSIVVAAGCYVQTADDEADPCIDIIVGNNKKKDILQILSDYMTQNGQGGALIDIGHTNEYEALRINAPMDHTRAYIKVQDGCNQFCSYCIIPYARGRVRSRQTDDVLREVEQLVQNGFREFVLTGIHLSSYGADLGGESSLIDLIEQVGAIDGVLRIRLGSLEPRIITEEFVDRLSKVPGFCPHFHLSLQSGSDTVLCRMNRKYTTGEYADACRLIRAVYPTAALTTDIIVGFPGETEEEFADTCRYVREIGFFQVHVFKYSPRKNTPAARMDGQIPESEKSSRSKKLSIVASECEEQFLKSLYGKELEILLEEPYIPGSGKNSPKKEDISGWFTGHSREYVRVAVYVPEGEANRVVHRTLFGENDENIQIIH